MPRPTPPDSSGVGILGLAGYRHRIFYGLAVAGGLLLLPFALNNLLQGRLALGLLTVVVVAIFLVNAVAIYRGQAPPVPVVLAFLPAAVALVLSVRLQGVIGVLWTYPAMIMFHFALERRTANILNVLLVSGMVPLAYSTLGAELALRVAVTMVLTIAFSNIFSGIAAGLERQLRELVVRDPLTGAYNRRHMEVCLHEAIERWRRHGAPSSLIVLDVDHFKRINDELGHAAGDQALRGVVAELRARLRRLDLLFRSGGEEFLALLADTDLDGAAALAEQLRAGIAGAPLLQQRPLTISLGVGTLRPGEDADAWLRRCDRALYQAKSAGRDRVALAT